MTIHPDVYKRGVNRANALMHAVAKSHFIAARYTGNMLEQNHLLAPELTPIGMREARILYPPIIMMHQLIETIDNHPIASQIVDTLLSPIVSTFLSMSGDQLPDQSETRRRRSNEKYEMIDTLALNEAKTSNVSSINVIYPTI